VVITDPLLGVSLNLPNLAPGGVSVQSVGSTLTADLVNTATVAGDPSFADGTPIPGEPNVTDTDTAAVELVAPSISLAKRTGHRHQRRPDHLLLHRHQHW